MEFKRDKLNEIAYYLYGIQYYDLMQEQQNIIINFIDNEKPL